MAISSVNHLFFKDQTELTSLIFDSHEMHLHSGVYICIMLISWSSCQIEQVVLISLNQVNINELIR